MKKRPKSQVTVLVAKSYQSRLKTIEKSLRSAGMSGLEPQPAIGVITGEIETRNKARLLAIPGVVAVEESQAYQLPPPDAEVQ